MKKPKRIHSLMMGGHRIKVAHCKELDGRWGEYDSDAMIIRLNMAMIKERRDYVDVLRHEMRHAAFHIGGVAYCEKMEEEALVRCLDHLFDPAWAKVLARL